MRFAIAGPAILVSMLVAGCMGPTSDVSSSDGRPPAADAAGPSHVPLRPHPPLAPRTRASGEDHVSLMAKWSFRQQIRQTLALDSPVGRHAGRQWTLSDILVTASFEPPVYVYWEVEGPAELIASYVADLRARYEDDDRLYDFGAKKDLGPRDPDPDLRSKRAARVSARMGSLHRARGILDWATHEWPPDEPRTRLRALQWNADTREAVWIVEGSEEAVAQYLDSLRQTPGLQELSSEAFDVTFEPLGC